MLDFDDYLDQLASSAPTPGGGSAAALTGAMAAALVAMVARITLQSEKLGPVHAQAAALVDEADALRTAFLAARTADEAAYAAVVTAQALPKATDGEKATRTAALQAALTGAAEAPLATAALAGAAMALGERGAALRNAHLMSDIDCALRLARAALDAAEANVKVNHRFLKNAETVAAQAQRLSAIRDAARDHESRALATVASA